MKPPTKPPSPGLPDPPAPTPDQDPPGPAPAKRPGGHGSYRLGSEPAIGHRWSDAPAPAPPTMTLFDDGVPQNRAPRDGEEEDPLHNVDVEHEHRDVNVRAVLGSAAVLVVVVLVSQVLILILFRVLESQAAAKDPELSPVAVPAVDMPKTTTGSPFFNPGVGGPQLMTNEPMGLAGVRAEEQKRLQSYGWVNQAAGVAHLPIDEAKKLLRERGLPVREGEAASPTLGTRLPARGESSGGRVITTAPAGASPAAAPETAPAPAPGDKPHGETPPAKPHGPGGH